MDKVLKQVKEVAQYLWDREWAERNAGNISINITDKLDEDFKQAESIKTIEMQRALPILEGYFFYVTGTGRRMRCIARNPIEEGAIIRVGKGGRTYEILTSPAVIPTSELPTHLSIQQLFVKQKNNYKVVLHTHPTEMIALTHTYKFLNEENLNHMLWSMHPETFIVVPQGVGIVPYEIPGSVDIADLTLQALEKHDFVIWEKHGVLGVGEDLVETFDLIDTLNKSVKIYMSALAVDKQPVGLNEKQLKDLIKPFNIKILNND